MYQYNQNRSTYRSSSPRWNNSNNFQRGNNYAIQRSNKPRSGCSSKSHTKTGEAKTVIYGWKYTKKNGLVKFVATQAASKYQNHAQKEKYVKMVAKVTSQFGEKLVWCLWNNDKKILLFSDMKMVASPSKNYWSFLTPKK